MPIAPVIADLMVFEQYIIAKYSQPMVQHARRVIGAYVVWLAEQGILPDYPDAFSEARRVEFIATSWSVTRYRTDTQETPIGMPYLNPKNCVQRVADSMLKKVEVFMRRRRVSDVDPEFEFPDSAEMTARTRKLSSFHTIRHHISIFMEFSRSGYPLTSSTPPSRGDLVGSYVVLSQPGVDPWAAL